MAKQYIDKAAVVAEIERRIKETESMQPKFDQFWAGQISAFKGVLKILDTIELKEVDLEEKATQLSQKYFPNEENIWARPNIEAHKCKSACIEMVEWLKAQKG